MEKEAKLGLNVLVHDGFVGFGILIGGIAVGEDDLAVEFNAVDGAVTGKYRALLGFRGSVFVVAYGYGGVGGDILAVNLQCGHKAVEERGVFRGGAGVCLVFLVSLEAVVGGERFGVVVIVDIVHKAEVGPERLFRHAVFRGLGLVCGEGVGGGCATADGAFLVGACAVLDGLMLKAV